MITKIILQNNNHLTFPLAIYNWDMFFYNHLQYTDLYVTFFIFDQMVWMFTTYVGICSKGTTLMGSKLIMFNTIKAKINENEMKSQG